MPAEELIHHFAGAVLESGLRHGVTAGLPALSELDRRGHRWTGRDFVHFMRVTGLALDDAFYGLAKSPLPVKSSEFGVEIAVLSDTLGDALDRFARFYEISTDGLAMQLQVSGRTAQFEVTAADPARDPRHFLVEWNVTRLIGLTQWLIGKEIPQLEVEFAHPPEVSRGAYLSVLGERVRFGHDGNRFLFPSRLLDRRVVRGVKDLTALDSPEFNPEKRNYRQRSWRNLLKASLRANLHRMEPLPTMEELASRFEVSSQTLRRKLKSEATSYRQIKAEARREVVENTIADSSLTLSEISVLAGFAETNGLVRAMKSWTGLSPSAFRRSMITGGSEPAPDDPPET